MITYAMSSICSEMSPPFMLLMVDAKPDYIFPTLLNHLLYFYSPCLWIHYRFPLDQFDRNNCRNRYLYAILDVL